LEFHKDNSAAVYMHLQAFGSKFQLTANRRLGYFGNDRRIG